MKGQSYHAKTILDNYDDRKITFLAFKNSPEVNFLDVNSAIFVHIGNFLSHWQFSFTLKIFFHIENFRSHCQISNFAAHFLLPASAGQLARFCKSEISIHIGNFHSHRKFSFTLAIFFHIGNFHSHRKLFGTKKLTSGVSVSVALLIFCHFLQPAGLCGFL